MAPTVESLVEMKHGAAWGEPKDAGATEIGADEHMPWPEALTDP